MYMYQRVRLRSSHVGLQSVQLVQTLITYHFPVLVRLFRQIKFGDKKIEESGMRDILRFQGACEEEGTQNLKRIKQISNEL